MVDWAERDPAMRENRMMPIGQNTFYLNIAAKPDGALTGEVYCAALDRSAPFTSVSRMIVLVEEWLDTVEEQRPPGKPPGTAVEADFELEVILRQNYSWQGRLRSTKKNKETMFRSVLELLIQLETILAQ